MSCHIEIRSGGPIGSICGDRHLFCFCFQTTASPWTAVLRVLRPLVCRRAGWTSLNADVFSASRLRVQPLGKTAGSPAARTNISARARAQRRPLSFEMEGRRFMGGCKVPFSRSRLHFCGRFCGAPLLGILGVGELPCLQRLNLGRWCAPGRSEESRPKDGLMLKVSADKGGGASLAQTLLRSAFKK